MEDALKNILEHYVWNNLYICCIFLFYHFSSQSFSKCEIVTLRIRKARGPPFILLFHMRNMCFLIVQMLRRIGLATNMESPKRKHDYGFQDRRKIKEVFGKTNIVFRRCIFFCLAQKSHGWLTSCVWLRCIPSSLAACVYVGINKRERKIVWDRAKVILEQL